MTQVQPGSRRKTEIAIALVVAAAGVVGGWALLAGSREAPPPFAVVDDCNAEAEFAARSGAPEIEIPESVPEAGTLYGITTTNDAFPSARIAYQHCMERKGYSLGPRDGAPEQS